jgi:Ca2+-dependent lipid-binding protein
MSVRVSVVEARNLPSADSNGLSDPFYWVLFNNEQKKESSVIYKTLNPKWEETPFEL